MSIKQRMMSLLTVQDDDDMVAIDEMRIAVAREAIPLMQETYLQLVAILEKHLGGPMPLAGLTKLGLQLSLATQDEVLLLVGPSDLAPKDMDRIK